MWYPARQLHNLEADGKRDVSLFAELKRRNVIRVVVAYLAGAWLLIQVADTVFPAYGLAPAALTTLITVLVIGLVPAIIISWVFELTPEGFKRDSGVPANESVEPRPTKWLDRIIMIVLALGVGYFAFDKFVLDPARDARHEQAAEERGRTSALIESYGEKSIAVLPFVDLSESGDQAYFSDGVAEEILNLLTKVSELRVISRSSAFQYRGGDMHVPTVAEELNVSHVLEGSVRKAGDRIRISVQLIDARTDTHLWSQTYDREFQDIFAIQDDIAESIVQELQLALLDGGPKSYRTDPETYALYLQAHHGYFVLQDYSEANHALLQQVLDRDPDYVPALNLMVQLVFSLTGEEPGSRYTFDEGVALMRTYVDRALAIDPGNSHANAHRGWMAFHYQDDLETAMLYMNRALDYDPSNLFALFSASVISGQIGRTDDAIAFGRAALARDPLCSPCLYVLSRAYFRAGRLDEAQAAAERRMRVAPGGWITLGNIHLFKGDAREALQCYDKHAGDRAGWLGATAIAQLELGNESAYQDAVSELSTLGTEGAYGEIAKLYAWVGDADRAFLWLGRHLDPDVPDAKKRYADIVWSPFFAKLHSDPRWLALRKEAGLDSERLAAIRIDVPESRRD
jgi:adenylate cyclase